MSEFFHMGGYALYVWSAYGLTVVAMVALVIMPITRRRQLLREIADDVRLEEVNSDKDTV